jgi:hypothetical protein
MVTIETNIEKITAKLGTTKYQTEEIVRRIFLRGMAPAPLPEIFVFNQGPEVTYDYPRMGIDRLEFFSRECDIADEASLLTYIQDSAKSVYDMTRIVPVVPEPEPEPPVVTEPEEPVDEPVDETPPEEGGEDTNPLPSEEPNDDIAETEVGDEAPDVPVDESDANPVDEETK